MTPLFDLPSCLIYDVNLQETNQNEEASSDEDPEISKWESIIWLSILTAWVSLLSGYLVDAIEVT